MYTQTIRQMDNRDKRFVAYYDNYPYSIIERIKSRSVANSNGCIEYGGGNLKHKYGLISITVNGKSQSVPAHRAMWMAVNNRLDLPGYIYIRHTCDNPCCVNIGHLVPGTAKDNSQDMLERGRKAKTHILHTRQCRLTDDQVLDIRNGNEKPSYYCCKYDITAGYVSKLRNMKAKALV